MKILIIPDVHGRIFWKEPCEHPENWDKIIFLGDYTDPYPGEVKKEDVIPNLQEIISFKEVYKDKVILLWGNHDLFYWCEPYRKEFNYWCRHDYNRHDDIEKIFIQHNELFQWAWQYDKFVFTHAGITNSFGRFLNKEFKKVDAETINSFFNSRENQIFLAMVSWYRGGSDNFGSIVWADIHEHYGKTPNKFLIDFFQIFGHTYSNNPLITENFAMLDVGGKWYYLEDGIIKNSDGSYNNIL